MIEAVGPVVSVIKAAWEAVSGIAGRRAARKVTERLRLIPDTMRAAQQGKPAPLVFYEPGVAQATRIPPGDIPDLLHRLEREGFIMPAPFGGWWLRERAGSPSPHRLFG